MAFVQSQVAGIGRCVGLVQCPVLTEELSERCIRLHRGAEFAL